MLAALAALFLSIVAAVTLIACVEAGYFRGPLINAVAARSGRHIRVDGSLRMKLLSFHPQISAERVTIGNPPWVPAGTTAEIGKITVVFDMRGWGRSFGIDRLVMEGATLHFIRLANGHANWQWTDPDKDSGGGLPLLKSLSVPDAHVLLDDARRHLQFDGMVQARDVIGKPGAQSLQIEGTGQLNGKAAVFEVTGDPLASVSSDNPYHFAFTGRSSGSLLTGRGALVRPFDFYALDTSFDASGADLKDLYFLTGVTLPNTGVYHVSGMLSRRGSITRFSGLAASSGQSDLRGTMSIDSASGRPQIVADVNSQFLRLADLGARAAGREVRSGTGVPLLLSNAVINPVALRRGETVVNFKARRLDVGRVSLHALAAKMTIDHGILVVTPLSAEVLGGKLAVRVRLDATKDNPAAEVDIRITDAQIGQLAQKDQGDPPVEGLLRARVSVTGHGRSVHQVAASASGTVTAVIPHGTMRASLAELIGMDLRGLGLILTKQKQQTGIRCGVASFEARDGTLTAQTLVLDTDPVLITGDGMIHLDSEALDLSLLGHPKALRLVRLHSPVAVRGYLAHPTFGTRDGPSVAQTAGAVALGVVLTPLAAVLAFVDPGLAKDADCASLIAQATAPPHK